MSLHHNWLLDSLSVDARARMAANFNDNAVMPHEFAKDVIETLKPTKISGMPVPPTTRLDQTGTMSVFAVVRLLAALLVQIMEFRAAVGNTYLSFTVRLSAPQLRHQVEKITGSR